jgi:hypothetical protein
LVIEVEVDGVGQRVLVGSGLLALPLESLLHLLRCSPLRFSRWSTHFVLCEVAQPLERLTDRQPFESTLLNGSQVFPIGETEFAARNVALRFQFSREFVALLLGNRVALLPGFIGTGAYAAPWCIIDNTNLARLRGAGKRAVIAAT